jgi:hypothetical protein
LVIADWGYRGSPRAATSFPDTLLRLAGGPPNSLWADGFIGRPPLGNYLRLHVEAESRDGALEITQLNISPGLEHPEGGLVTDDLRLIRLHEVARNLLVKITTGDESDWGNSPIGNPPMPPREWATSLAKRPGRRGRDDYEYAQVARHYVALLGTATPLKHLADQLGFSASQVRNILYEARRRDLLTDAPKGKAGGTLTPYAYELLQQHDPTATDINRTE